MFVRACTMQFAQCVHRPVLRYWCEQSTYQELLYIDCEREASLSPGAKKWQIQLSGHQIIFSLHLAACV